MSARLSSRSGQALCLALFSVFVCGCSARVRPDRVAETEAGAVDCSELRQFAAALSAAADPTASASQSVLVEELVLTKLLAAEGTNADSAEQRALRWQMRQQLAERAVAVAAPKPTIAAVPAAATDAPVVGDAEIAAYYAAHAADFVHPERIRTRLILVRLGAGASAGQQREATTRLRDIQAKFLSGTPFPDLAVRFSEADNATYGGDVGPKARGEMPTAFESVAWNLEPGEVSDIVSLPDGVGLILLEAVEPPRAEPLEEVQDEIRARLTAGSAPAADTDVAVEAEPAPSEPTALTEARSRARVTIDREALLNLDLDVTSTPVVTIGADKLSLADLGLTTRPPGVDTALTAAIDTELLARLAESQGNSVGNESGPALARRHQQALAALDRRVEARLPASSEDALREAYAAAAERFARPERRLLEVVRVMAESGDLGSARAAADALGRVWRPGAPAPQRHRAEVWGPIDQEHLETATSADLAATAFGLDVGSVTPPLLVEHAWSELAYVLLRVARIEPAGTAPFEEVRATLASEGDAVTRSAVRAQVRTELLGQAELRTLPALFDCNLSTPLSPAEAATEPATPPARRQGHGWPAAEKQRATEDR